MGACMAKNFLGKAPLPIFCTKILATDENVILFSKARKDDEMMKFLPEI